MSEFVSEKGDLKIPSIEKMLNEIAQLDKALSGAKDDHQRLIVLSAAFLEHKRESVHWQISMYKQQKRNVEQ